ncbi:MAG: hypothetical protein J2P54_25855 [Bradyrhizobiaceae bacterium]|nr:hypothetical protein [Bradyrhizobiaceae bacterium]
MKRMSLLLVASTTLIAGTLATANALDVQVGPGGVRVGPDRHYEYRDEPRECRVIITHHTNRFGEDVEERRRICD